MKLIRIHVENFGALSGLDLDFSEGLNVLHQKNGWGKSTLAVFIKAMLYGLPASSRRSLDENERKKYTPWQGGAFGGSLEFEVSGGKYRIERFFGAKESADSFALFDLCTNKPSSAYTAAIGEELLGIDADGFERSTYLSQRLLDDRCDNSSISAKLGSLLDDVGDIGSFDEAIELLDRRRRYYVMTGNRGAIADLERERVEKQAELERCLRVREAMLAQEARRDEVAAELNRLQVRIEKVRAELTRASRARELAALIEQKTQMQAQIDEMTRRQAELAAHFVDGEIPSQEALAAARRLYEQIRADSVRLETLSAPTADTREREALAERYPSGIPSEELLAQASERVEELRRCEARREALSAALHTDPMTEKFPSGTPSEERIHAASQALTNAQKLRKTATGMEPTAPKRSPILPIAILLLPVGLVLAALTLAGTLPSPALLAAGACILSGLALALVGSTLRARARRRAEALAAKRREWQDRIAQEEQAVRDLLNAYRVPIRDGDLAAALTELSLLASQYRAGQKNRRKISDEIATLTERQAEHHTMLRRFLRAYTETSVNTTEDYQNAIHTLRQSAAQLSRLEESERRRDADLRELRATLNRSKQALLPFLHRFDPKETLRAGDCLDQISESRATFVQLGERLTAQKQALAAFIREKGLDSLPATVDTDAFERIESEDRALRARAEELQKQYTVLGSEIDRLAVDADRVPELSEEQVRLKGAIDEAKANAATVANTMKLLEESKTALSTRYLDGMQESFRRFFSQLTGEDAPQSLMDTSFEVRLREAGQTRTMESFSRGWRDAVRFCVRLSLADALFAEGERPFLLLDDPFVNLDDDRLVAAKALLERLSEDYQILYLVCNRDRI